MMVLLYPLIVLAFLPLVQSVSVESSGLEVKHAWTQIPEGWKLHGTPASDHLISLRIGLKQDKLDELIETLYRVSDPLHPQYGQHLSRLYELYQNVSMLLTF